MLEILETLEYLAETYLGPCETSMVERLAKKKKKKKNG